MTDPVVVLDSGVIERITTDKAFRSLLGDLVRDGWFPLIPTVTLAEVITGTPRDAPANQAINRLGSVDSDQAIARRAGSLRFHARAADGKRAPGAVDAIVAAHALEGAAGVVFTTDPGDLRRLLADYGRIRIEAP